jgi:hypothetical protein
VSESIEAVYCVIGQRQHQAHDGMYVCRHHLGKLAQALRDIEEQAVYLEIAPSLAIRWDNSGGGLASEQAPARLDVLAHLDNRTRRYAALDRPEPQHKPAPKSVGPWCLMCDHQTCTDWRIGRQPDQHDDEYDVGSERTSSVLAVLHSWATVVREDRGLTRPETVTITGERDLLTRHLVWVCEQAWVDEFHAEITELAARLRAFNHDEPDRPLSGWCFRLVDGEECGGRLWPADPKHTSGYVAPDKPAAVVCERDHRHRWEGLDLARLALIVEQQQEKKRAS